MSTGRTQGQGGPGQGGVECRDSGQSSPEPAFRKQTATVPGLKTGECRVKSEECVCFGSFEQFSLLPFATNEIRFFGPPRRMRHVFALHLFLTKAGAIYSPRVGGKWSCQEAGSKWQEAKARPVLKNFPLSFSHKVSQKSSSNRTNAPN